MAVASPLLAPGHSPPATSEDEGGADADGFDPLGSVLTGQAISGRSGRPSPITVGPESAHVLDAKALTSGTAHLEGRIAALVRAQPTAVQVAVADALADLDRPPTLDEDLWGAPPSDEEYMAATVRSAKRIERLEDALLSTGQTLAETARRLGVSEDVVRDRVSRDEIVVMERDADMILPGWQFTDGGSVVPGIAQVRRAFPGGVLSLSAWVTEPNDRLGGRTPRQLLVEGNTERVAAAALAIGS